MKTTQIIMMLAALVAACAISFMIPIDVEDAETGSETCTVTIIAMPNYGHVSSESVTVVPGTTVTSNGNELAFSDGQTVTIDPENWTFMGWVYESNTIDEDTSIFARFDRSMEA